MSLLLAALLVAADQLTKLWAKSTFPSGDELELALGFSFTYVRNSGAAFGLLRDRNLVLGPLTIDGTLLLGLLSAAVSAFLLVYLLRNGPRLAIHYRLALALVLGGAVGNMIDRLTLGYVVDFVHFQVGSFDFPVFNLADACVVVGAGLLFLAGLSPEGAKAEDRQPL